ncbi:hypothetical protein UFOVP961_4 [uncultured Caudovirales phage]|uniref:Uncharacterized protein n=1 Tax=uncultured Caudovirales phage TaxID=2100421 RepID=A0A6J5QLF7_9CAUD|nr:hypothetical protein UFOVP961_4 [uncultured Caudovirales phage]CAB4185450.1 hypothetical protein UFOVP1123_74 [uncultured Caudovirales phage]CAB4193419.1 hypothetical protein UFOVP1239_76 [uncultured Caudovirales phage]CAB4216099.1 hypothetical protein UFOVP1484_78 [uncultured Caudovirales phage]CAB5230740.1 hypothetical protein UFOVP1577_84 [uncultured Caudovirales phage]
MEDIINHIDGKVQVIFERGPTPSQTFRDALWFTQAEHDAISATEILALQQQRYDNWLAVINAPSTEE